MQSLFRTKDMRHCCLSTQLIVHPLWNRKRHIFRTESSKPANQSRYPSEASSGEQGRGGSNVSINYIIQQSYQSPTDILHSWGGGLDVTLWLTDHICSQRVDVQNRRRLFSFGSGNEAADWIMMPFLIRLFPLQDIAPPLLLSIIQYLTRGDFLLNSGAMMTMWFLVTL